MTATATETGLLGALRVRLAERWDDPSARISDLQPFGDGLYILRHGLEEF